MKEFKDHEQVITFIAEIFKFISIVTTVYRRDKAPAELSKLKKMCYEDLEQLILSKQENKILLVQSKLLEEIWPLVENKIESALLMCVNKKLDYIGQD